MSVSFSHFSQTNHFFPNFFFCVIQIEVFNILFIREQEKRHVVHCMGCARKQSPTLQGFVCLEEYRTSELNQVYDQFVLHKPLPPPIQSITPNPTTQQQNQPKETVVAS